MDQSILVCQFHFLVRASIKIGFITFFLNYLLNGLLAFVIFDAGSDAILTKKVIKDFCNIVFAHDYISFLMSTCSLL